MFTGFTDATIETFLGIRFNNSKGWMDAHRQEYYLHVRDLFYALIDDLAPVALEIDSEMETRPHKCLSRINRDTRFSRDKSLYRDHLWFCFHKAGCPKESCPMYWFEFGPDQISWGLGTWFENRPMMDVMRKRMEARPEDFIKLIRQVKKQGMYIGGNAFKRMEIPESIPEALKPLYAKKEIYISRDDIAHAWAFREDLKDRISADFLALKPFYRMMLGCFDAADGV